MMLSLVALVYQRKLVWLEVTQLCLWRRIRTLQLFSTMIFRKDLEAGQTPMPPFTSSLPGIIPTLRLPFVSDFDPPTLRPRNDHLLRLPSVCLDKS